MDYMRPLVDSGTAPEAYGDAVMEVHMKRWKERMLIHESEQRAALDRIQAGAIQQDFTPEQYSSYHDRKGYYGYSPTGAYWRHMYKTFGAKLRPHFDMQVKLRTGAYVTVCLL